MKKIIDFVAGNLRKLLYVIAVITAIVFISVSLFAINGMVLSDRETPVSGITGHPASATDNGSAPVEIRLMAYNIAKGFIHKGGLKFEDPDIMNARIISIAEIVNREQPDLLFLSEAVFECGPCPVNQVKSLAEKTGMYMWAFGENYNFGLPFFRIVGGNAVLSRLPLDPEDNPSLAGRKPFYVTKNNRRVLWCSAEIAKQRILLASVHNDSFNLKNNLLQTRQILKYAGNQPTIFAGDFNARPDEPPIKLIRSTGRFQAVFDGPLTFPAKKPAQKIDFIFVPADWKLMNHRVIQTNVSDHRPVVSIFRLPDAGI
ncbi:MAG: hypothetical protein GY795_09710 [Desulfobacterales bacterium]|nr:hypothetical protein [Desulfobacterales bacterium]